MDWTGVRAEEETGDVAATADVAIAADVAGGDGVVTTAGTGCICSCLHSSMGAGLDGCVRLVVDDAGGTDLDAGVLPPTPTADVFLAAAEAEEAHVLPREELDPPTSTGVPLSPLRSAV